MKPLSSTMAVIGLTSLALVTTSPVTATAAPTATTPSFLASAPSSTPSTPDVHAVSRYSPGTLVVEGTVADAPAGILVIASIDGTDVAEQVAENGSFWLSVPDEHAGQNVEIRAFSDDSPSAATTVDLIETEGNTASEAWPLTLDSPVAGSLLTDQTASFVGSGIPDSRIVVTRDAGQGSPVVTLCETRIASSGDWSCTSPIPPGDHAATATEVPTWASATRQTARTAFSVTDEVTAVPRPLQPTVSSITADESGDLVVRAVSHGAGNARIVVGGHSWAVRAEQGRFAFTLDPSSLGRTATITGIHGLTESRPLDVALTPVEAAAPSPLTPPMVHGISQADSTQSFVLEATTDYFADEWELPSVTAYVDGEPAGRPVTNAAGAVSVLMNAAHAGKWVELVTTRGDERSEAAEFWLEPTEVNTAPETFPLDVTSIAEGSTVPTGTPVITGKGIPGSTISLTTDVTPDVAPLLADVLGDGSWTVELDAPLAEGDHTLTVTETPYWQTLAPIVSTRSFTVSDEADDESDDDRTDLAVTSHADGGRYSTGIATFTGRGTPEARLTAANQWGTPMGSTRVDEDGDWSFTRNLGPTSAGYDITFTMTPTTGAPTLLTLHLDYEAPSRPLTVTSHVDGGSYREGMARFTGTGTVGAQLVSTNQWGTQMGKATIGSDGTWAFSRNLGPTNPGYVLTFVATHGSDEQRTTVTLTHQKDDLVDVQISSPVIRDGGISESHRTVTFRGTATPFAAVVGKNQWGTPFGSTTASSTGAFAFDRYVGPAGTTYELTFEQKATDGTTKTTTGIDFVTGR